MLKIAYAEADITPENGEDLCGFALRSKGSNGVHDRLKIKWLSVADPFGQPYLLGAADIISVSRNTFGAMVSQIEESLSSPAAGIGLSTSHTHSGPVTVTLRNCGRVNKPYLAAMKHRIVETAVRATGERSYPVKVLVGHSKSDEGINRRQGESGPVDRDVTTIILAHPASGKPRAIIANFACHPVVLGHVNNGVSADYPGYLQQYVEQQTGAPCMFINGACGDINPRHGDHSAKPEDARRIGQSVGQSVMQAIASAREVIIDQIHWHTQTVNLPVYQPSSASELDDRLDMIHRKFGLPRDLFADRVARDKVLLNTDKYPRTIRIEIALLSLGSQLGILYVPGELFASLGLKFKSIFGPRNIIISGFSNGSVGYLPDRQAYADGGYEPYFANFFYDFPQLDPSVEDVLIHGVTALASRASRSVTMKSV